MQNAAMQWSEGPLVNLMDRPRGFLVLMVFGVLLAPRVSQAAERYMVVESPPFQVRAAEQERLMSAIASGLRAAGCEVVGQTVRVDRCTTAACWKKLAAGTKATDLLVVTGGYKNLGWQMSFEHRSGATGAKVGSERENCDACPFDAMVEKAAVTAQHIAESDRTEASAQAPVTTEKPVESPLTQSVPASNVKPAQGGADANPLLTSPPAEASPAESRPVWPIFLMAGGGIAMTGGIVLVAIHGRDTECSEDTCARRYKTMTPGLILSGVGLAAVAVGIWQYVAWHPAGSSVSLRVGPGGLSLAGGF